MTTKKFSEFISEGSELTEDYAEQCREYKQEAMQECDRIKACFQEMLKDGIVYHSAKHVSRQLEDIADILENFKDQADDRNNGPEGGPLY